MENQELHDEMWMVAQAQVLLLLPYVQSAVVCRVKVTQLVLVRPFDALEAQWHVSFLLVPRAPLFFPPCDVDDLGADCAIPNDRPRAIRGRCINFRRSPCRLVLGLAEVSCESRVHHESRKVRKPEPLVSKLLTTHPLGSRSVSCRAGASVGEATNLMW